MLIMGIPAKLKWLAKLGSMFATIYRSYDIKLTKGCSIHVHVSPNNPDSAPHGNGLIIDQFSGTMRALPRGIVTRT